jgi:hypothetical protein
MRTRITKARLQKMVDVINCQAQFEVKDGHGGTYVGPLVLDHYGAMSPHSYRLEIEGHTPYGSMRVTANEMRVALFAIIDTLHMADKDKEMTHAGTLVTLRSEDR